MAAVYIQSKLKTQVSTLREADIDSHSTCSLVLSVGNTIQAIQPCSTQLQKRNGMIFQIRSIILRMEPAAYSTDAIHNGTYGRLIQCLRNYSLALLTLYTPDSIKRTIKSGYIDFVKQSAVCVTVSIQSTPHCLLHRGRVHKCARRLL